MRATKPTTGTCAIALLVLLSPPASRSPPTDPRRPRAGRADLRIRAPAARSPALRPETEALLVAAQSDPAALGPLSIGTPDAGLLLNPVALPERAVLDGPRPARDLGHGRDDRRHRHRDRGGRGPLPRLAPPRHRRPQPTRAGGGSTGTARTRRAATPTSASTTARGEVDSFLAARKKDLDLPRTWAFVRALVTETDVERIFVDRSLISVLYAHAVAEGEDRGWLDDIFGRTSEKGIIQHERRHKDHLHVRFFNPRAQERGADRLPGARGDGGGAPSDGEAPGAPGRDARARWRGGTGRASLRSGPRTACGARACARAGATRSRSGACRPTAGPVFVPPRPAPAPSCGARLRPAVSRGRPRKRSPAPRAALTGAHASSGVIQAGPGGGSWEAMRSRSLSTSSSTTTSRRLRRRDEALGHGVVEQRHERVVVAGHVQDADRLAVDAELAPGHDLEELLEGAHAAGEGDEAVGQLGHERLAGVHGGDDAHVGDAAVGELARGEAVGDDAGHRPPAARTWSARTPMRPTEPPPKTTPIPRATSARARAARRPGVARVAARARAAEDADAAHGTAQRPFGNIAISRPKPAAAAQP